MMINMSRCMKLMTICEKIVFIHQSQRSNHSCLCVFFDIENIICIMRMKFQQTTPLFVLDINLYLEIVMILNVGFLEVTYI